MPQCNRASHHAPFLPDQTRENLVCRVDPADLGKVSALIVVLILATWVKTWVKNQNILETSMNTGGLPKTVDLAQEKPVFNLAVGLKDGWGK